MSIGKSPEAMVHWTVTESPKFAGSEPNSKCAIFGGTIVEKTN